MAYRARAAMANLEFVQFHPTSLFRPACPNPNSGARGESGLSKCLVKISG